MTIWLIGALFTAGIQNYLDDDRRFWHCLLLGVLSFCIWPFLLGSSIAAYLDDRKEPEKPHSTP